MASDSSYKELPVSIQCCTMAYPAKPTPHLTVSLSNIDHTVVFMVDVIYFYSRGSEEGAAHVLLKALEECLVAFYPFAGRLRFDQKSQRLELDCNSAGVPFADATTNVCIEDLGDLSLPNPLFRNLLLTPQNITSVSESPQLTVQVTRFKCGGFSLGFSASHALSDGIGIIDFMKHFSSIARGESLQPIELNWDRTMLKARTPPTPTIDFGDAYYKSTEIPNTQSFSTIEDMLNSNLSSNYVVTDLVSKAIHISSRKIESLKKQALADGTLSKCSTFDALAAYLWKLRTAASEMPLDHESIMFVAVDVSNKTCPPLPRGFFGNRAFPVSAKLPAKELYSKSLSFCVKVVQEALTGVNDEYVRSWIDWSEIHRGIPKFNGGFYLSSWWKFPFYDMDYGWGKPIYMGPVLTQRVEFVLILPVPPSKPEGGVDVLLTLKPQQMQKFETIINSSTISTISSASQEQNSPELCM